MFQKLAELRDSLLAARFLREEILGQAVLPDAALRLRREFLRENTPHGGRRAMEAAMDRGRAPAVVVSRETLAEIAAAAGSAEPRSHSGATFHGKPAPAASEAAELFDELLETVNSPVAVESWPAPVRAFAL